MPNLEPVEVAHVGIPGSQILDLRRGRTFPKPLDHLFDRRLVALDVGLDMAVGTIADPAGDTELFCLDARPGAEKDALDSSRDAEVTRDFSHHTVDMSGASSAFIPTTL